MKIKAKNKVKIAIVLSVMALFIVATAVFFYRYLRNDEIYINSVYEKINSEEYTTYYNGCIVDDPSTVKLNQCHIEVDDDKKVITLTPSKHTSY